MEVGGLGSWGKGGDSAPLLSAGLSRMKLGQAVTILIGGAQEALFAVPGEHCITLRRRKGFVCLVLRHG